MADNQDVVLKIKVRDAHGNFLGGKVDIRLEHTRLQSELREMRAVDASGEIAVRGLRRSPEADYKVSITRADPWMQQTKVVRIPASGTATLVFDFDVPKGGDGSTDGEERPPVGERLVAGQVIREDKQPFPGGLVRAFHEDSRGTLRLGEDTTDEEGRYTLRYEMPPGVASVRLRVSVSGEDGKTLRSSDIIPNPKPVEIVNLTVPLLGGGSTRRWLEGRIVLENGRPAENLPLVLVRHDFGGAEARIADTVTRAGGLYALSFDTGGKPVSLQVRAVDAAGKEVPLSKTLRNLGDQERTILNLVAPASLQPLAAEYRRLEEDLKPHIGAMAKLAEAKETRDRQDLTLLSRATGWDARLIALAANAAKLNADPKVGLSQEVLYGLSRSGLPSDKLQLAQVSADAFEQALKKARESGIIELSDPQLAQARNQFEKFSRETRLEIPAPGSTSTYGDLLSAAGVSADARDKFPRVFLSHQGDGAQLWEKAVQAGIGGDDIKALQKQGKLAFLTRNSEPMTRHLQAKIQDPGQLVEEGFFQSAPWKDELRQLAPDDARLAALIPPTYEAEKLEDRLSAYAEDMARKVRLSYPTQVVAYKVEKEEHDPFRLGDARSATGTLLKQAAAEGFRLGQTPVEAFVRDHPEVLRGVGAVEPAVEGMKTLQRVYQITPSDEAIPTLMSLGLTSAYDVVALSQDVFLDRYERYFPSRKQAELVYRKAQQVSSVTYNLFTIARKLDSDTQMYGLSASAGERDEVKGELIKRFPTLESLFGSMDFCDCEHCRSVLSPAAYLVDLLHFIDPETNEWENFLKDWKARHNGNPYPHGSLKPYDVLVERRPDLPNIQLTCANTHTALPYIDIVNEILEYYVAKGTLEAAAARDTGDATTPELLAEPQNVIAEAYAELQKAETRYPLLLPFDLWIETARRFCDAFETPLWRLLEAFRESEVLFAPTQPYDRAGIAIESLELSPAETALFTDPNPLPKWFELYGYETAPQATTVARDPDGQRIDLNSAKALSRRLGVTYKELVEIVQTGFVNPKLAELVILHKLGVTPRDVFYYQAHKGSPDPEVEAFERRLVELTEKHAGSGFNAKAWLDDALEDNAFDDALVLADPDAGCDFDLTTLRYAREDKPADDIAFLRINLFVRLWRKLGWTIEETDRALMAFVPKNAPFDAAHLAQAPLKTALIYLARLKVLDERLRIGKQGRLKLLTLWSDLATTGKNPLYAQLFLTRSALRSDPVFDDPLGRYLSSEGLAVLVESRKHEVELEDVAPADQLNPAPFAARPKLTLTYDTLQEAQRLAYEGVLTDEEKAQINALAPSPVLSELLDAVQAKARDFTRIQGHLLALQGALGLTAEEIGRILASDAPLSLANVSELYRHGLLAKALKLSVGDLIALKDLSGLDPFKPLRDDPLTAIEEDHPFSQTLRFVEIAGEVRDSGLTAEDLDYFLRHHIQDPAGKYRPAPEATRVLLKTLAEGVRAIRAEHAVPEDPGTIEDETLRPKLGLALPPEVVERFLAMMNGRLPQDPQQVKAFVLKSEAGFLEDADFDELFTPLRELLLIQPTDTPEQIEERSRENERIEKENLATLQGRYAGIAKAFFPFLQQRLIRQLIVQTLTAQTGAEPVLVESLLTDARLLADSPAGTPRSLLAVFTETGERGIDADFFDSNDGLGVRQPTSPRVASADTALKDTKDKDGNPLNPAHSARFQGYLEVPAPGAYRFHGVLGEPGAEAELRFDHLPGSWLLNDAALADGAELELKPGVLYGFTLELRKLNGGEARLLVRSETLPKDSLARLALYPRTVIEGGERAMILLAKSLRLLQSLGLNEREARYMLTHAADFENLSLSKLPAREGGGTPDQARELFSQFLRLAGYARLKRDLAGGTDDLIGVFEAPELAQAYARLARLTRRDAATVKAVSKSLFAAPAFRDELAVERLWDALRIVERFGVPVASLGKWTRIVNPAAPPEERFAIARDLREAIKARFEPEAWQRVAMPIFDKLRQRQRDALSAYVMHRLRFSRREQLYEYFLIDPGMEPVVQTSRIRLAISSVQLFIQRCLLNLELEVHPSTIDSKQWEWMKRYRVWEANRKIFLFPENWLEPEFRDDKTHLFTELEGALLQGDVSNDLVEDAFLDYLKKLEELARLDIVAMHLEDKADPAKNTLHVIGRTFGEPHKYFYRRYAHGMWTPWEPVTAEIDGDHLAPVIWRDRLHLFWVTFRDRPNEDAQPGSTTGAQTIAGAKIADLMSDVKAAGKDKQLDVQLHWSEYLGGKWSTRKSGGFVPMTTLSSVSGKRRLRTVPFTASLSFDTRSFLIHVSKEYENGEERGVYIHLTGEIGQSFYLAGRNSTPVKADGRPLPKNAFNPRTVRATRFLATGNLTVKVKETIPAKDVLRKGGDYTLLPCDNDITLGGPEIAALAEPVFYQDDAHTLFVESTVTERTIEQWTGWVPPTSQPTLEWDQPRWWTDMIMTSNVPIPEIQIFIDPDDPVWKIPVGHESLINPKLYQDWLANPGTGLLFDGELITAGGRAGVTVAPSTEVVGALAGGGTLNVNAGSGLAMGSVLVVSEGDVFAQSGLTNVVGGLNVIGAGGFNASLAQGFEALKGSGFGTGNVGAARTVAENRR